MPKYGKKEGFFVFCAYFPTVKNADSHLFTIFWSIIHTKALDMIEKKEYNIKAMPPKGNFK